MSDSVNENPQALVTDNEQLQRSSPTRRVAARNSDVDLRERSQALLDVMKQVDRVSYTDLPVLLIGGPGTGAQLVACAIHQRSAHSAQPFVAVNCGTLSPEAIEAEVFGSDPNQPGLWEKADGGTVFFAEITETNLSFQERLLRTLRTGEISRAGSDEKRKVSVRLIVSSSRDLEQEVSAGKFLGDLFHALSALSIVLPPPRARETAPDQRVNEDWVTLSEVEGRYVERVLKHTGGNKQAAARVLSVDRKTLDRMIKRHHIIYPHTRPRAKPSLLS
jgi:DNA-binding NtrC family response regulator